MKEHNNLYWSLLVLLVILFSGCNKDAQDDGENTPELRLIAYSMQSSVPNERLLRTNLVYNTDGSLALMDFEPYPNLNRLFKYNIDGRLIQGGDHYYHYNTNGQIDTITSVSQDTALINYNSAGKVDYIDYVYTKTFEGPNYYHQEFRYDDRNRLQLVINKKKEPFEDEDSFTVLTYDDIGNVIKMNSERDNEITETIYNYDDKKNPYYDLLKTTGFSVRPSLVYLYGLPSLVAGYGAYFYSANNLVSIEQNHAYGQDSWSFIYEYNNEGYPIEALMTYVRVDIDGNQEASFTEEETWEYEVNPFKD